MIFRQKIIMPELNYAEFEKLIISKNIDIDIKSCHYNIIVIMKNFIDKISTDGLEFYGFLRFSRQNSSNYSYSYPNSIRVESDEYSDNYGKLNINFSDLNIKNFDNIILCYTSLFDYRKKTFSKEIIVKLCNVQYNTYGGKNSALMSIFTNYISEIHKHFDDIIFSPAADVALEKYKKKWFKQNLSNSAKARRRVKAIKSLSESFNSKKINLEKKDLIHVFSLLLKDKNAIMALATWYNRNYKTRFALNEDIENIINEAVDSATVLDILD